MSQRVYSVSAWEVGLNNQRLILLGLVATAYFEGAKVALPKRLVDFTPVPSGDKPQQSPTIPFEEVFDTEFLHEGLARYNIFTDEPATQELSGFDCFNRGHEFNAWTFDGGLEEESLDQEIISEFLRHLRSAAPLRNLAGRAIEALGGPPPIALQLRIERDWRQFVEKWKGFSTNEEATTAPQRIFQKIANAPELRGERRILACCDEDDLVETQGELKEHAKEFGFDLIFKSELERELDVPKSRLQRSCIDFDVCLRLDRCVGLTRSTFSNMLYTLKALETIPQSPEHYVYNHLGDAAIRRAPVNLSRTARRALMPRQGASESFPDGADRERERDRASLSWTKLEIGRLRKDLYALRREKVIRDEELKRLRGEIQSMRMEQGSHAGEISRLNESVSQIRLARDAEVGRLVERLDKQRKKQQKRLKAQQAANEKLRDKLATRTSGWRWSLAAPVRSISARLRSR